MIRHTSHRLVPVLTSAISAIAATTTTSPPVTIRRGPSRQYSARVTICPPAMTPSAEGNVMSPDRTAERPSASWKNRAARNSAPR